MAKTSSLFMCSSCGNEFTKWAGQCPACKQWNSLTEVTSFTRPSRSSSKSSPPVKPVSPKKALTQTKTIHFLTNISELDRVLGQGVTQGGIYLIAGQPGIGKSTLLTQLAIKLSSSSKKTSILYVCSEENPAQVALRINRLHPSPTTNLDLLDTSSVESVLDTISRHSYQLIIVDSIQSISTDPKPHYSRISFSNPWQRQSFYQSRQSFSNSSCPIWSSASHTSSTEKLIRPFCSNVSDFAFGWGHCSGGLYCTE